MDFHEWVSRWNVTLRCSWYLQERREGAISQHQGWTPPQQRLPARPATPRPQGLLRRRRLKRPRRGFRGAICAVGHGRGWAQICCKAFCHFANDCVGADAPHCWTLEGPGVWVLQEGLREGRGGESLMRRPSDLCTRTTCSASSGP